MGRVSVIQLHALVEAVEREGARSEDLRQRAGLDAQIWASPGAWIPAPDFDRMIALAVELTRDPAFGLHWGERTSLMKYDLITPLVGTARDLRTALGDIVRFQRLVIEHPALTLIEAGGSVILRSQFPQGNEVARRARAEMAHVGFCRTLSFYCGHLGVPSRVEFDYPAPEYRLEYERLFGGALAFDSAECSLSFDAALLDVPQVQYNPRIYETIRHEAERALERLEGNQHVTIALRTRLSDAFPDLPDMSAAARELGMSERSLRRRLAAEGTTFHELLQEARVGGALRLLANPGSSIKETAYTMGFTSPSAFHRAFKRWTGMSPSAARNGRAQRN